MPIPWKWVIGAIVAWVAMPRKLHGSKELGDTIRGAVERAAPPWAHAALAAARANPGPLTRTTDAAHSLARAATRAGALPALPMRVAVKGETVATLGGRAAVEANPWARDALRRGRVNPGTHLRVIERAEGESDDDALVRVAGWGVLGDAWDATGGALMSAGEDALTSAIGVLAGSASDVAHATAGVIEAASGGVIPAQQLATALDEIASASEAALAIIADAARAGLDARTWAKVYATARDAARAATPALEYGALLANVIPGGQGVAAGLAYAGALSAGRGLDDAAKAAAYAAIPGGAAARAAIAAADTIIETGELGDAALVAARELVPEEARDAYDRALTIAAAQRMQRS